MARYQYETSPRKLKPEYEPIKKKYPSKSSAKKSKTTNKYDKKMKTTSKIKMVFYVLVGFTIFFTISYRNAVIDAKYAEIKTLKSELATVEKENEQLEANIESSLNLKTIQEVAEEELGMQVLSSDQIEYISLPKTDYVESSSEEVQIEEEETNYLTQIINILKNLIK